MIASLSKKLYLISPFLKNNCEDIFFIIKAKPTAFSMLGNMSDIASFLSDWFRKEINEKIAVSFQWLESPDQSEDFQVEFAAGVSFSQGL